MTAPANRRATAKRATPAPAFAFQQESPHDR